MQFFAVIFFVGCLFLFSYERFRANRQWEIKGLLFALAGVLLDAVGVLLSRYGFDHTPQVSGIEGHFMRSVAALVVLLIVSPYFRVPFYEPFKKLVFKERFMVSMASVMGTFLSLVLYMQAIKIGKMATVTSIVLTDPMISTTLESFWKRQWPSRYMWAALVCFAFAMLCLFYPQFA